MGDHPDVLRRAGEVPAPGAVLGHLRRPRAAGDVHLRRRRPDRALRLGPLRVRGLPAVHGGPAAAVRRRRPGRPGQQPVPQARQPGRAEHRRSSTAPHLFTKIDGRRLATPLFAVLVLVELTDLIFAVDSVPAVLAVSHEQFIVFSSNAFAILGLRSLYFLLADLHGRFRFLQQGLAVILAFVGVKMIIAEWVHIPTWISLVVIAVVLLVGHHGVAVVPGSAGGDRRSAGRRAATGSACRPGPSAARKRPPMAIADDDIERLRSTVSIVDVVGQFVHAAQGRAQLGRAVPVPRREDAVVQRPRGDRPLQAASAATSPATCSRSSRSTSTSTSSAPSRTSPPRPASSSPTRRRASPASGPSASGSSRRWTTAVEWYHQRLLDDPAARAGPRLPALARPRRRRRPPVQARLGARRLGRAGRGSPASTAELLRTTGLAFVNRRDRHAGRLPGPGAVPDLHRQRRGGGDRRARSCPAPTTRRSTRTRRRRRSTPSRRRCTG